MRNLALALAALATASLSSCTDGRSRPAGAGGDTIAMRYAENIVMVAHEGYTTVELRDPWNKGKALHTYVLVPEGTEPPGGLPRGTVVRTPVRRAVVATSVHCGLAIALGKGDRIRGVCDLGYINIPYIREGHDAGRIADCGNGTTPSLERIIEIDADALLISPFQNSGGYGRLAAWGRPIIETADYMETSPLGRAEWMRFYGLLLGAEEEADSMFRAVERRYAELRDMAMGSSTRQSVIFDRMNGPVWYVPGGRSTIGRMVEDSNSSYAYSTNGDSGSLPLPFESVLERAGQSDVWLFRYNSPRAITYRELLAEHPGYSQLKAFRQRRAYGCNTRLGTFYEDTPFHPDTLLRDLVIITHPDLPGLGEPTYFRMVDE